MHQLKAIALASVLAVACVPVAFGLSLPPLAPPDTSGSSAPAPKAARPAPPAPQPVAPAPTAEPRKPPPAEARKPAPPPADEMIEEVQQEPEPPKPAAFAPPEKSNVEAGARIQADSRSFHYRFTDKSALAGRQGDILDLRSARIEMRALAGTRFEGKLSADFGNNKVKLADGYLDWAVLPSQQIRVGQFNYPFGNEPQGSSKHDIFVENAMLTSMATVGRDRGVSWQGNVFEDRVFFQFSGMQGAGENKPDNNDAADKVARVTFRVQGEEDASGIWLGGSYANGARRSQDDELAIRAESRSGVNFFKTKIPKSLDYFVRSFDYEATVIQGGFTLQAEQYELGYSVQRLLTIKGGYASISWITGGQRRYRRGQWTRTAVGSGLSKGGWGAFEFAVRYSYAAVDPAFFEDNTLFDGWKAVSTLMEPDFNVAQIKGWTWGINWFPEERVRLMLNWVITSTEDIGAAVKKQELADESAYLLRFQMEF